jgi:hypothetical protein
MLEAISQLSRQLCIVENCLGSCKRPAMARFTGDISHRCVVHTFAYKPAIITKHNRIHTLKWVIFSLAFKVQGTN